jgi:hypothetical protein
MSRTKGPKKICLTPGCGRDTDCHGLCPGCHGIARALIMKGETTWEELESKGLATNRKPSAFRIAFDGAKGVADPIKTVRKSKRAAVKEKAVP